MMSLYSLIAVQRNTTNKVTKLIVFILKECCCFVVVVFCFLFFGGVHVPFTYTRRYVLCANENIPNTTYILTF